jgi:3-oxoacyl-[acyl-carrier-protein] synthase II
MSFATKRVAVTGMAGITGLGDHWEAIEANLRAGRNAVRRIPEWAAIEGLNTPPRRTG